MNKNPTTPSAEPPVQDNNTNPNLEPTVAEVHTDTVVVEGKPVVMPEPATTPADAPAPDPVAVAPSENTVLLKPPKKKFSLAAIIGFVVFGLLLVGGIGFAIWFFAVYQNPQNIAFDAVNKFLSAPSVQTKGEVSFRTKNDEGNNYISFSVKLDNKSKTLPNSATADLTISEVTEAGSVVEDHTISIDLGTAIMSDGVIYFQVANLKDALDKVLTEQTLPENDFSNAIFDMIETVDGEWWRISIPEVVDELDLGSSGEPIKDLYSCVIDASKKDHSGQIAGYYRDHQFINVEKTDEIGGANKGNTYYKVDLDYDNLAGFLNEMPNSDLTGDVLVCINDYAEATGGETVSKNDAEKISADDIRKEMPEDLNIYLQISDFSHQLETVSFNSKSDGEYDLTGAFSFTYEPAEVKAPENYRPVSELVEEIVNILSAYITFTPDYGYEDPYYDEPWLDDETGLDLPMNSDSAFGQTGV